METKEIVVLVFLCFVYFDFASRSRVLASAIMVVWVFIWYVLFHKKLMKFEMDIPNEWYWSITSGAAAVTVLYFSVSSLLLLAYQLFTKILTPTQTWYFAIPISGITGFGVYVLQTARQIKWKQARKVYKFRPVFSALVIKLLGKYDR